MSGPVRLGAAAALVVVDLQRGTVDLPAAHPVADVVARAGTLIAAFRDRGWPVVRCTVRGLPRGETSHGPGGRTFDDAWCAPLAELPEHPHDVVVPHTSWSAFAGTDLDATLRGRGVNQLVIAGLATHIGVESTARAGYDLGYDVVVVSDAVTASDPVGHENSLTAVVPLLGRVSTTTALLAALDDQVIDRTC